MTVSCKCKKLHKIYILGTPARNHVMIPLRRIHTVGPSWTLSSISSTASSALTINSRPEAPFGRLTYKMFSKFSNATDYTFPSSIINNESELFAFGWQFHIRTAYRLPWCFPVVPTLKQGNAKIIPQITSWSPPHSYHCTFTHHFTIPLCKL